MSAPLLLSNMSWGKLRLAEAVGAGKLADVLPAAETALADAAGT